MNKRTLTIIIVAGMLLSNVSFAATKTNPNFQFESATPQAQYNNYEGYSSEYSVPQSFAAPLKGSVTMVPAGTSFAATTSSEISTTALSLGQGVTMSLPSNFYYNGKLIAPAGSQVSGNVILLKKAGLAGKNGQIKIRFTNIYTPQGQMIPISGVIRTSDGTGILKAATAKDTTKDYVKDIGIGAASGAVLGTAMGAMAQGSVGLGAIYGTALGGGLGLGKSVIDKGIDINIPANSKIDIVIDQPITVSPSAKY
ncbi:MAG: hypothetical protein PHV37_00085 [Candidatus Gastranaerophilales bacterium]|nr:hypothetical protein [Candidatus Gastranaerophilales bacterium]